jgi:hypothetical protein
MPTHHSAQGSPVTRVDDDIFSAGGLMTGTKRGLSALVAAVLLLSTAPVLKAEEKEKSQSQPGMFIKYKPPLMGKPGGRVGGGTRGTGAADLYLAAIVPDHAGMTAKSTPTLCWFLSRPTNTKIEITVDDGTSVKPILEKKIESRAGDALNCLNLSQLGIVLRPGAEYQWFVAIVPDPEQRSKDIVSGGGIVFTEPAKPLADRLSRAKGADIPKAYAEAGFWYDAFDSLSELIRSNPEEKEYQALRLDLLEQAGLPEVARHYRK